jgi:hypothetical protein
VLVRRLLLLALGPLLLAAGPSQAAGLGADVVASAEAHFNVYGSDHASYLVDLTARSTEAGTRGGPGSVTVTIRRCLGAGCPTRITYVGAVPAGAFTVAQDLSSGYLSTSLFGRPLAISWFGAQGPALASYTVSPDGPDVGVRLYQVTHAGGVLTGKPCQSKDGLVARSVVVDAVSPPSRPLPRTLPRALAGMARGVCSKPTS